MGLLGARRGCLDLGRSPLLPHAQATSQLRLEAEHVPHGGRVLDWCGARRCPTVHALWPHGSGGRLLQLHGRLHDHRGRHHRDTGGESLEDHTWTILVPAGGNDQDIYPREDVAHLFAREGAGEIYPTVPPGQGAQIFYKRLESLQVTVAVEGCVQFGREISEGPDQYVAALVRRQGSYKADPERRGEGPVFPSYARGVYAVVGNLDLSRSYAIGEQ